MDYRLDVCRGNHLPEIIDPSPEAIEKAINELLPMKNHFVILDSEKKVENCSYIQTIISDDKGHEDDVPQITFCVELRFNYDKPLFKQYKTYVSDIDLVKKMFRMFALGIVPDVTGWIDITEEMNELSRKKKEE